MTRKISLIYLITFILAYCSIVYELLMAQSLSLLTGNNVLRYSITIGLYLASMGIGAFLCRGKRLENPISTLLKIELMLIIFGGAAVLLINFSHMIGNFIWRREYNILGLIFFFTSTHALIMLVGILSGFELPLLMHLGEKEKKNTANIVLGVDYLGSLAGAIFFPLLLLPRLGVLGVSFVTALLNIVASLLLLFYSEDLRKRVSTTVFSAANLSLLLLLLLSLGNLDNIRQFVLKRYYYYDSIKTFKELFSSQEELPRIERYRSPYQEIDIVRARAQPLNELIYAVYNDRYEEEPDYPKDYFLYLNGDYQFFSAVEEIYHEYFVHVPIIANKIPKKVLVLGGGDGLIDRELLKYKQIEMITHVDIDPEIIEVSSNHPALVRMNGDSLKDPRVHIKFMDAFYFVKTTREKYDAIFMDFPDPMDYNLSRLYSREFYSFVGNLLNEEGFAVLDAPTIQDIWPIYYNSIKAAGFKTIVPYTTIMERDNPRLDKMLDYVISVMDIKDPEEKIDVKLYLKEHAEQTIAGLEQGFIMMEEEAGEINEEYVDMKVNTYVLNEKRYGLAFTRPFPMPDKIDWSKVNSIIRPTLPSLSFFYIKSS